MSILEATVSLYFCPECKDQRYKLKLEEKMPFSWKIAPKRLESGEIILELSNRVIKNAVKQFKSGTTGVYGCYFDGKITDLKEENHLIAIHKCRIIYSDSAHMPRAADKEGKKDNS